MSTPPVPPAPPKVPPPPPVTAAPERLWGSIGDRARRLSLHRTCHVNLIAVDEFRTDMGKGVISKGGSKPQRAAISITIVSAGYLVEMEPDRATAKGEEFNTRFVVPHASVQYAVPADE